MFHYKQVNISLNAAVGRLKQTREERDQFHEANNQMVISLQAKVLYFPDYPVSVLILLYLMRVMLSNMLLV